MDIERVGTPGFLFIIPLVLCLPKLLCSIMAGVRTDHNNPGNWDESKESLPDLNGVEEVEADKEGEVGVEDGHGSHTAHTVGSMQGNVDTQGGDVAENHTLGINQRNIDIQSVDYAGNSNGNSVVAGSDPAANGELLGSGHGNGDSAGNVRRRNSLNDYQRRAMYAMLLERTPAGKLKRGVTKSIASDTGVPLRVVQRIWQKGKNGGGMHAVVSQKAKRCGRKRVLLLDPEVIRAVPLSQRKTLQDLANALGVSKSTVFRRLKEGVLRRVGSSTDSVSA